MLGPVMVTKEQWPTRMVPRETARSLMAQEGETADSGSKRVSAQEVRAIPGQNRTPKPRQEPELVAPVKAKVKGKEVEPKALTESLRETEADHLGLLPPMPLALLSVYER